MIYIQNEKEATDLISRLLIDSPTLYPFDIETTGLDPHSDDILLIQFELPQTNELYVLNCRKLSIKSVGDILRALWRGGEGGLLGHNLKFDISFLLTNFPDIYFHRAYDTYIADILITNGIVHKPPSLAELAEKYLGKELDKTDRKTFVDYKGDEFSEKLLKYAARDVEILTPIYQAQKEHLRKKDLITVADIECKAVAAFAMLETNGIFMDQTKWKNNEVYAKNKRRDVLLKMDDFAKPYYAPLLTFFDEGLSSINWNSPIQVLDLLRKVVDNIIN